MGESSGQLTAKLKIRQWGFFFLKALIALFVIYLVVHIAPVLPPAAIGVLWAAMSATVSIGISYPYIIRKLLNRYEYEPDGHLSRINDGRIIRLIASFAVAAVLVAGLLLETAKWGTFEWVIAVLAIPVFLACCAPLSKVVSREFRKDFRKARLIQFSRIATTTMLCIVYMVALSAFPAESYTNAAEAFLASTNPFQESPSALLCEGGKFTSLVNGLYAYFVSKTTEGAFSVYVIWKVLLGASALYSISAVMGLCALRSCDVRQVFAPLEKIGNTDEDDEGDEIDADSHASTDAVSTASPSLPLVMRFVAVIVMLPVVLAVLFTVADTKAHDIVDTQEYTAMDQIIRNQVGLTVCVIDGKTYDYETVKDFLKRYGADSTNLCEEARNELAPLINEVFDKRVENVDKYLNWYYSLSADYECLLHFVDNTVEDYALQQLDSTINDGVDDTLLNEKFAYYADQAAALESAATQELAAYEVDVPDWLITAREELDTTDVLSSPFDTTERLQEAGARLAAGGVGAFVLNHLIGKNVFKKMVEKLASKLGVKATTKIISFGLTAVGPLGVVLKISADVVTTVVLDNLILMADETMNRDTYKQELIDGINEQRNEMLSLLEPSQPEAQPEAG